MSSEFKRLCLLLSGAEEGGARRGGRRLVGGQNTRPGRTIPLSRRRGV